MARSPLTLAASVTSALPRVGVVGVGVLTEGTAGRYDSAVVHLDDGRKVVVRVPADPSGNQELAAEVRSLRALTPGVRGLLPFRAPELLGEADLGDSRAVVVDYLPGYRVDAAHLPAGRGAATSLGEALAALHGLPTSIVRTEGLPVRSPSQVRDDIVRLLDRAEATRRVPDELIIRWHRAVASDTLWRFESAVVLGGAGAPSFLFEDVEGAPTVTGVLDWHGLSVGDPAADLQWLASAPAAAEDVYGAYAAHSTRAPDGLVRERARLYAELEFAKWLVHGHDAGDETIVEDAVGLLTALAEGVEGDDLLADGGLDVDDAIALLDRVPPAAPAAVDTSMQTDAYDPAMLSLYLAAEQADADDAERHETRPVPDFSVGLDEDGAPSAPSTAPRRRTSSVPADRSPEDAPAPMSAAGTATASPSAPHPDDDVSTAPIDISAWTDRPGATDEDAQVAADRSAEAALRRWTGNGE